jgi:erythromycin esterase-like protein
MTRFSLLLIALCLCLQLHAQDRNELLKKYTSSVKSIAIADTNDAELQTLATAIGNSRIVILGEMDNGDGETFRAKARIVRYLHQKMGFNVLAFESDFYSTNMLWDNHQRGDSALLAVWDVWRETEEFQDMSQYITQHSKGRNPLAITGFDCQIFYKPGALNFMYRAESLLEALGYDKPTAQNYIHTLMKANDYDSTKRMPDSAIHFLYRNTERAMAGLKAKPDLDPSGMWSQSFSSMMGNASNCWLNRKVPVGYNFLKIVMDGTMHEKQMASNLHWLATRKYKNQKIIVWSTNQHITKNNDLLQVDISNYRKKNNTTMGHEIYSLLKDDVFILGFTSADGTSGSPYQRNGQPYKIGAMSRHDWYTGSLSSANLNYAFTNFKAIRSYPAAGKEFTMRGWGYEYDMIGQWFNVFDGMFFIKKNRAATPSGEYYYEEEEEEEEPAPTKPKKK